MKGFLIRCFLVLFFALLAASVCLAGGQSEAGKVSVDLTYWSVCNYVGYDEFWEKVAEKYNAEHPEVDLALTLTCIPYQGYAAKYKSAFDAGKGPDIFFDMTHVTAGELEVSEKMPADIAQTLEGVLAGPGKAVGVYDGVRYGVPVEGGYFMMTFINDDLYKEAGLAPKGAETFMEMLEHSKKLTKTDASGKITQTGYAIRYAGHPFGIADKALPFVDAWGTKVLDWNSKKASGYVNGAEAVEAIEFYGGLAQTSKVSSLELGKPMEIFGQGIAGMMFRESFAVGWNKKNNPNLNFSVYPLPKHKRIAGYAGNFPWSIQVNVDAPEEHRKWAWEVMRFYSNSKELRKAHAIAANIIPPFGDLLNEPEFISHPAYDAFMTMAAGREATNYHIPPAQEILQIFGQAVLDVMFGKEAAKPALDKAAVGMDEVLARYK